MSEYDCLMLKKWKKLPEEKKQEILARISQKASGKTLDPIDLDKLVKNCSDKLNEEEK